MAKIHLRELVTEQDAEDAVTLLIDATREAFTSDQGVVAFELGKKGGTSISKQVKCHRLYLLLP